MNRALSETARLAQLLGREQSAFAELLLALADFDRRRLWVELGHSSLFYFLHRELRLSKGAAHYRKVAVELVQRFPEVIEPLRDGRLCITSVVALAKVMTKENRKEVLPRFFHCSKREALAEAAAIRPADAAPHREVVTAVRTDGPAVTAQCGVGDGAQVLVQPDEPNLAAPSPSAIGANAPKVPTPATTANAPSHAAGANEAAHVPCLARRQPLSAEPVTADLRRLHVTVSRRFLDKLEAARAALSHSRPGASAEEILEAGLDLLLERSARRKGLVARPRATLTDATTTANQAATPNDGAVPAAQALPEPLASSSAYIPARVKRAVWTRDEGRCQWPLASGGICGSTHRLQIDHVLPRALGGPSTLANTRLLCQSHNLLAARHVFGNSWMDRFSRGESRHDEPDQALDCSG